MKFILHYYRFISQGHHDLQSPTSDYLTDSFLLNAGKYFAFQFVQLRPSCWLSHPLPSGCDSVSWPSPASVGGCRSCPKRPSLSAKIQSGFFGFFPYQCDGKILAPGMCDKDMIAINKKICKLGRSPFVCPWQIFAENCIALFVHYSQLC